MMIEGISLAGVWGSLKSLPGIAALIQKHRCARVARDLATLRFWCDGMAAPLRHIAEGRCSQVDLDEIDAGLKQTKNEVRKVKRRLQKARADLVATALGMKIANDLDSVIYEKLGPGSIRPQLEHLVETKNCSAEKAIELLRKISLFNEHLDSVHEAIRPKAQQSAAVPARGRRSTTRRTA